jgi:hypothetical protein
MRLCRCVIIDMYLCTSDAFSLHVLGCNLYGYERQLVVVSMKVNVGKKIVGQALVVTFHRLEYK